MTSADVVRRTVHGACLKAWQKAKARGESPFVECAYVSPNGAAVVLQTPPRVERRKIGDWTHITPTCATGTVWRAVSELARIIRERLPDSDISCVSYRFRAPDDWTIAYEHHEAAA